LELYAAASVLPEYAMAKLRDALIVRGWSDYPVPRSWTLLFPSRLLGYTESQRARRRRQRKRLAWEVFLLVDKVLAVARLANFLAFLYNGRCVLGSGARAR
jgi:peroxin-2